jgi:hypothetical protein
MSSERVSLLVCSNNASRNGTKSVTVGKIKRITRNMVKLEIFPKKESEVKAYGLEGM